MTSASAGPMPVHPSVREAIEATAAQVARVIERIGFGPLADIAREHMATGGKRFRARLALQAAAELGVDPQLAVPFAAACELLHNATLVHDDLMDGDTVRRGQPAVWAAHGVGQAICAGDLLLMAPFAALDDPRYAPELRWHLSAAVMRRASVTACGQSLELALEAGADLSWEAYRRSAMGKTGALCGLPVEGAALLAGLGPKRAKALGNAAGLLGMGFQVRDDVLDLWGDKGRGQRGNDLREGKISAIIVVCAEQHPEAMEDVCRVLLTERDATTDAMVQRTIDRFEALGIPGTVAQRLRGHLAALDAASVREAFAGQPRLDHLIRRVAEDLLAGVDAMATALSPRAEGRTERGAGAHPVRPGPDHVPPGQPCGS